MVSVRHGRFRGLSPIAARFGECLAHERQQTLGREVGTALHALFQTFASLKTVGGAVIWLDAANRLASRQVALPMAGHQLAARHLNHA